MRFKRGRFIFAHPEYDAPHEKELDRRILHHDGELSHGRARPLRVV